MVLLKVLWSCVVSTGVDAGVEFWVSGVLLVGLGFVMEARAGGGGVAFGVLINSHIVC